MFRFLVPGAVALIVLSPANILRAAEQEPPNDATAHLSALGRPPDWTDLEKYQSSITRDEFMQLLDRVYCTRGYKPELIKVEPNAARIVMKSGMPGEFVLHFARSAAAQSSPAHWWKTPEKLPAPAAGKPLEGFHIALDPGHIGGDWAKMEERWFKIGNAEPVKEGDLTLRVAKMLKPRLESLGAKVSLVRENSEPLTPYRPSDFEEIARALLLRAGVADPRENFDGPNDPEKEKTVAWQRQLLFYRNSEIRRRASLVNYWLQPDLVLCLHFNAEPWGDPNHPTLVPNNHLHLLVNGAYLPNEVELDDERCEMLEKLLGRTFPEELDAADTIAAAMARKTALPPYHYKTDNVTPVGTSGYVVARNLMATRLYRCPTVYLEPYVMNSHEVFARIQAGDYEGQRHVAGKDRPSIFREYVDGVVEGVTDWFKQTRTRP
jgi:N-acetylmuramoyl-L-alanine amidase